MAQAVARSARGEIEAVRVDGRQVARRRIRNYRRRAAGAGDTKPNPFDHLAIIIM